MYVLPPPLRNTKWYNVCRWKVSEVEADRFQLPWLPRRGAAPSFPLPVRNFPHSQHIFPPLWESGLHFPGKRFTLWAPAEFPCQPSPPDRLAADHCPPARSQSRFLPSELLAESWSSLAELKHLSAPPVVGAQLKNQAGQGCHRLGPHCLQLAEEIPDSEALLICLTNWNSKRLGI